MSIQAYPLQWPAGWPRTTMRKRAQFGKSKPVYRDANDGRGPQHSYNRKEDLSVADGTKRVLQELERLGVQHGDAIVSTNMELRLDGFPRSDRAAPKDPGVAVYWLKRGGTQRVMAIDRYDRVADNLAAIAATLEAMRAIERHGGGQILERAFTGFDALPPPMAMASRWREILRFPPAPMLPTEEQLSARFRELARAAHPDAGGTEAAMSELNAARDEALRQIKASAKG